MRARRAARAGRGAISPPTRLISSRGCLCCASWLPLRWELKGDVQADARYSSSGWVVHKPSGEVQQGNFNWMQRGGAPDRERPLHLSSRTRALLDVLVDELRHLEHRDLLLAAENLSELLIGV